ncbi:MAG: Flp pilus assembly protein CpaB [Methylococcales bacterium]|nr:Flp pilus assembly protein CpaB [Methylococcales bacterium]
MKKKSLGPILLLVGSVGVGVVAAMMGGNYLDNQVTAEKTRLQGKYKMVKVVVPTSNLPVGTIMSYGNVASRSVPKEFVHSDAITPDRYSELIGSALVTPAEVGKPILYSHVTKGKVSSGFSNRIDKGKRAMTFPVDTVSSISGLLVPGDKIDLLATLRDNKVNVTMTLLKNVTILATDQKTAPGSEMNSRGQSSAPQAITIMVSPENASKIIHVRSEGTLTAILRGPTDNEINSNERVTLQSLMGKKKVVKKK